MQRQAGEDSLQLLLVVGTEQSQRAPFTRHGRGLPQPQEMAGRSEFSGTLGLAGLRFLHRRVLGALGHVGHQFSQEFQDFLRYLQMGRRVRSLAAVGLTRPKRVVSSVMGRESMSCTAATICSRSSASAYGSLSQWNFSTTRSQDNGRVGAPSKSVCSRMSSWPPFVVTATRTGVVRG